MLNRPTFGGHIIARSFCRDTPTRTEDPLVPNQVRYQLRHIPKSSLNGDGKGSHFFVLAEIFCRKIKIAYLCPPNGEVGEWLKPSVC